MNVYTHMHLTCDNFDPPGQPRGPCAPIWADVFIHHTMQDSGRVENYHRFNVATRNIKINVCGLGGGKRSFQNLDSVQVSPAGATVYHIKQQKQQQS